MISLNNIYERVRELAKKRGLSLQTVAEKAGIGINSIYRWRHATPKLDTVEKVAHALNVSSDYLLTGNQAQPADHQPKKYQDLDDKNTVMLYGGQALTDDELAVIKSVLTAYRNEKRGE